MNKSIIIYGPSACGKTHHGAALAKHFGLDRVVELDQTHWTNGASEKLGVLFLTSKKPLNTTIDTINFEEAMTLAGLKNDSPIVRARAHKKAKEHGWILRVNIGGGVSAALVPTGERPNPHTLVFFTITDAINYLEKQS